MTRSRTRLADPTMNVELLSVTDSQREILEMLVSQELARKQASAEGVEELLDYEVKYLVDLHSLLGIVEYGNFEWNSPEMFAAAATEVEQITLGLVAHKTPITSKLAGHWAGRILGAALRAAGNRPFEKKAS